MLLSTIQPADPQTSIPTPDQKDPKPQKFLQPAALTAQTQKSLRRISLHPTLTPYRRRVYRTLLSVPPGRWTTYSAMATYLGSSARAIGNAMRSNPFAPEVPCHRVVAADGSLEASYVKITLLPHKPDILLSTATSLPVHTRLLPSQKDSGDLLRKHTTPSLPLVLHRHLHDFQSTITVNNSAILHSYYNRSNNEDSTSDPPA
ncbi:Winged helix-turn-helix transcription repressor DNA-binding [Penicillium digitatum]|uniref:Methylated-DNA--protein-cysteine methyltransferase n=1 Tax=Penicillium digitatum TaxID=36651 RepID=A0A7T6XVH4_PENDI|nr:Winged helix-turn-helix transcription repressor DNA-binding [Penicillium digitatum]